ncbi:aminomethyl-transferring glycine dehydrogenase subunit GcvPA [Pseudothermotoga thermarum]|uniref:Probable glycine dehydrogenase (decarboxylating) subunit 1 n=1 Tax=Pseudothermotoga thermarum DSM 5069 TaxID=688269 RepID=F7YWE8_9THEM|nr:aminomethyl-transferring glycine dehydrogenase subunit GcvPA [Pseudothermotoga thermarum]AEH51926.1 glycine dehydrogenase (decarboxylating) alpha subunit [Pseudothermotoga thermarum DSM 5069]
MYPYIPHTEEDIKKMLETIGVDSIEELYLDVPKTVSKLNLPEGKDEFSVYRILKQMASSNKVVEKEKIFLGAGIYAHHIPQVVKALASRPEFVTAYTPYQAEVSQGTLQALFEYQTMICELTGMEVANSSMYDGASALAEAVLMAHRINSKSKVLISEAVHPEYVQTCRTYASAQNIFFEMIPVDETGMTSVEALKQKVDEDTCAVVVQYPNFFGVIEDLKVIKDAIKDAVFIVVAEPISLAILEPPGSFGADIVVGDGQPLGIEMNYGGPTVGFFATLEKHVRKMPGRIIGQTKDLEGKTGYVMILQAREQHIRREKATSNICTNHALMALTNAIYMSVLGPEGLKEVAKRCYTNAHYLAEKFEKIGLKRVFNGEFFNEFVVRVSNDYEAKWRKIFEKGFLGPLPLGWYFEKFKDCALACATEVNTKDSMDEFVEVLESDLS